MKQKLQQHGIVAAVVVVIVAILIALSMVAWTRDSARSHYQPQPEPQPEPDAADRRVRQVVKTVYCPASNTRHSAGVVVGVELCSVTYIRDDSDIWQAVETDGPEKMRYE